MKTPRRFSLSHHASHRWGLIHRGRCCRDVQLSCGGSEGSGSLKTEAAPRIETLFFPIPSPTGRPVTVGLVEITHDKGLCRGGILQDVLAKATRFSPHALEVEVEKAVLWRAAAGASIGLPRPPGEAFRAGRWRQRPELGAVGAGGLGPGPVGDG